MRKLQPASSWRLRSGQFRFGLKLKLPFIPGNDAAGRVVAMGQDAKVLRIGDEVMCMTPVAQGGAYAEFLAVDAELVARAPVTLPLAEAAGLPLVGLTALQGLRDHGRVREGTHLLVVGASGGVGHLAVQIGKALGAHVTAMTGPANLSFARHLGADEVLSYEDPSSFTGPKRLDIVLEAVATILSGADGMSLHR